MFAVKKHLGKDQKMLISLALVRNVTLQKVRGSRSGLKVRGRCDIFSQSDLLNGLAVEE